MQGIIEARLGNKKEVDDDSVLKEPGMAECAQHFISEHDRNEMQRLQQLIVKGKVEQGKGDKEKGTSPNIDAKQTKGNSEGSGRKKAIQIPETLDMEQARHMVPSVKRVTIRRETTWHTRVNAEYLTRPSGSKYHKKSYTSEPGSERMALLSCLRWLWSVHEECTGQDCPYAFEEDDG